MTTSQINKEFFRAIEAAPDFKVLHAPVKPDTRLTPSVYVARNDGTFVFLETVFADADGTEHIVGNPVRFPKMPGNPFKVGKVDRIFGVEIYNIMKILVGKMSDSHHTQVEGIKGIRASQEGTGYAIHPFRPTPYHIGCRFDRSEFVYHFPMDKTLDYFLAQNVESVIDAVEWAKRETGLKREELGLTGSSSLGIIDPKEDVDLCFMAPVKRLTQIRNLIRDGVKEGRYTPLEEYGHVWPLRVKADTFELCPFFVASDYEMDGAKIALGETLPDRTVTVTGDDRNMLSPVMLEVEDEKGRGIEIVITNGFNRGHFFKGDKLRLHAPQEAKITTRLRAFDALVLKSWNSAETIH